MQASKKDTKDGLYSQSAIAKTLGLSEATISRAIDELKLTPARIDGKSKLYTADQVEQIKEARKQGTTNKGNKAEIEKLRQDYIEQLRAKDKQIDQLNEQLRMAQINLSQSQQLQLKQAEHIKRLEAPQEATGAVVSASNGQGTDESTQDTKTAHKTNEDDQGEAKSPTIFQRLFGKKKKIKF